MCDFDSAMNSIFFLIVVCQNIEFSFVTNKHPFASIRINANKVIDFQYYFIGIYSIINKIIQYMPYNCCLSIDWICFLFSSLLASRAIWFSVTCCRHGVFNRRTRKPFNYELKFNKMSFRFWYKSILYLHWHMFFVFRTMAAYF